MDRLDYITDLNFTKTENRNIKYIVMHYVGAVSTAVNNGNYFKSEYRGASAHYFVDENSIVKVVDDNDIAWHCGAIIYTHPDARNTNSIGIEMCCKKNEKWYFENATVENTITLIKELMQKYNIPASNVIRHYDVTRKVCPEPFVRDEVFWNNFKSRLSNSEGNNEEIPNKEQTKNMYYINSKGVNLREKATLFSRVVKVMPFGYRVNVLGEEKDFYKTDDGYVRKKFATKEEDPKPNLKPRNYYALYITNASINVRSGPGLEHKVLKVYAKGTKFNIYEENNGWGHTPSGWVKLSFCNKL